MKKVAHLSLLLVFLGLFCFSLQAVPVKAETSPSYNSQSASLWETLSQINKLLEQLKALIAKKPEINPQSQLAAVIEITDVAAHWKLNEGSGTTASDSSGNGNSGVLVNGPLWTIGKVGSALSFDGVNDNVSVTSGSSINNLTAMTVSGWIYPRSSGGEGFGRIVRKGNTTAPDGTNMYWEISVGSNTLGFRAGYSTSFGGWIVSGIPFNQWTHVAVTYTHGNTLADPLIYINGVLQTATEQTTPAGTKLSDTSSLVIGDWGNGQRVFDGVIDEVRVFNRLLSATDINALYSADLGSPDTQAPITSISSPTSGLTVYGSVAVTATALDDFAVTRVELWKDSALFLTDTFSPYSFVWDTTLSTDGSHTLQTKAYDAAGNMGVSPSVTVTVNNVISSPTLPPPGYELAWSDEFNGSALDSTKWTAYGGPRKDAVNSPAAVSVQDGALALTTYTDAGIHYTGYISTKNKYYPRYGYMEARINFNDFSGVFSGFWLQSTTNGNPLGNPSVAGTEIDIVEHKKTTGFDGVDVSNEYVTNLFWDLTGTGYLSKLEGPKPSPPGSAPSLHGNYHTYALKWTPTSYTFYLDGQEKWITNTAVANCNCEFILLTSEVWDAAWPGHIPTSGYGSLATSMTKMKVDWVRVWQPAPITYLTIQNTGTGIGITRPLPGTHSNTQGAVIGLTTTPQTGSIFSGWSGDPDCADGSVTMNANKTCIATFTLSIPPSTKFSIGETVRTNSDTYVRSLPLTTFFMGIVLGTQPAGVSGTIVGGPIYADGFWWWNVNYATGVDGWSTEVGLDKATVSPAPTLSFSASPTSITSGSPSTLSWSSTNATSCTASGAWSGTKATSGTQVVNPTVTSTYTLTCTGSGGSIAQSTTITVTTVLTSTKFNIGDRVQTTATLNVRSTPSTSGILLGTQTMGALGTVIGGPTYAGGYHWWQVNFDNAPDGWSVEDFLNKVLPIPTLTLSASPTSITSGQSSTLTWSSTNATSCTASGAWSGTKATSGTQVVNPTVTSTYTLTCTGTGGSVIKFVTVTVSAVVDTTPPVISSVFSSGITTNSATITWATDEGATSQVDYGPTSSYGSQTTQTTSYVTSHSVSLNGLTAGTTYHFRVRSKNAAGLTSVSGDYTFITNTSVDTIAPTVSITAPISGATVSGSSVAVSANASDNVGVIGVQFKLDGANLGSEDTTSPYSITWNTTSIPNGSHVLTAVARDAGGNLGLSPSVSVNVNNTSPPPTLTLSASPTSITSGSPSTLTWSSTNAASCLASGAWAGSKTTSGTQIVNPTVTSTYTLTCTGSGGSITQLTTITVTAVLTSTKFNINDRAQTTAILNVRSTPSTSGTLLGTQGTGALGTVIGGPTYADGYHWWQVNFDNAPDGWSVEDFLNKVLPIPTLTLSASLTSVTPGSPSTLTWNSADTVSCLASGAWSGSKTTSGTQVVNPTVTSTYTLTCTGSGGSVIKSVAVTVSATADIISPSVPAGLTATAISSSQINLSWTASTDNVDVAGYKIFREGTQIVTVSGTTYADTELSPSTLYSYTVAAYDAAGNVSGQSLSSSATTQTSSVAAPPTPVSTGLLLPSNFNSLTQAQKIAVLTAKIAELRTLINNLLSQTRQALLTPSCIFTRDLSLGLVGEDIRCLQKYLNSSGFTISTFGLGSSGNESNYFGLRTMSAVLRWQRAYNVTPFTGYFGSKSKAKYLELSR